MTTGLQWMPSMGDPVIRPLAVGRVFFVDHFTGVDTNNGIDPGTPFKNIEEALANHCLAERNDYIILLNVWTEDEGYPVHVVISRVHIIGLDLPTPWGWQTLNGGGANVFSLEAAYCEIAGMSFTSAAADGISVVTAGNYGWIHHCAFAASGGLGLANGIAGADASVFAHGLIEDCYFSNPAGNPITADGITGGFIATTIRRNIFRAVGAVCIDLSNVEHGAICDNYFYAPISAGEAVGWAISLLGVPPCGGGPIINNHAVQTGDGTGSNPYRDTSTPGVIGTTMHGWGMNYSGQAVITPAAA